MLVLAVVTSLALAGAPMASPSSALAAAAAPSPLTADDWTSFRNRAPSGGFNSAESVLSPATVAGLRLLSRTPTAHAFQNRDQVGATGHGLFYRAAPRGITALDQATGATVWVAPLGSNAIALGGGAVYTVDQQGPWLLAYQATTGALLWQARLPGAATTSPTVVGSRVVVSVVQRFGRRLGEVVSVSAATGAIVRRTQVDTPGAISHVAVRDGVAVVTGAEGRVVALDLASGTRLWSRRLTADIQFYAHSPVIREGRVFVTHGQGFLQALDLRTGRRLWSHRLPSPVFTAPAAAGGLVYVAAGDAGVPDLFAYDAETGALRWSRSAGTSASSPTVANGVLYVGTFHGGTALKAFDAATGSPLGVWPTPFPLSEPMVSGGKVYVYDVDDGVSVFGLAPGG